MTKIRLIRSYNNPDSSPNNDIAPVTLGLVESTKPIIDAKRTIATAWFNFQSRKPDSDSGFIKELCEKFDSFTEIKDEFEDMIL